MVEIAISLAIIGFALVAIIGVLPIGMDAQKNNRQETIINQDAAYWIEAIRNGAQGLDDLTNYVDCITNVVTVYDANNQIVPGYPEVRGYTYTNTSVNGNPGNPAEALTDGYNIIGLLSTPKYVYNNPQNPAFSGFTSNYVFAYIHAISGAASEKAPQTNSAIKELAFSYRLVPEVIPYSGWDTNWVNYTDPVIVIAGNTNEITARSNYWQVAKNLRANLHDVRLLFRWPVFAGGKIGNGRQIFRTLASGRISGHQTNGLPGGPFYFFESRSYTNAP